MIAAALVVVGVPVGLLLALRVARGVLDETNGELVSAGVARDDLLHVPEDHDPTEPAPLIISMHEAAMWPAQHRNMTGWSKLADSLGFLVVYPGGRSIPRAWHGNSTSVAADVRFLSDLIETVSVTYGIDRARVYADGLSHGGRMVWVLSCRLPDVIAAVGTVAAANDLPWEECGDAPPVAAMVLHGTEDPVVPYRGGTTWAAPDVTRRTWVDCAADLVL